MRGNGVSTLKERMGKQETMRLCMTLLWCLCTLKDLPVLMRTILKALHLGPLELNDGDYIYVAFAYTSASTFTTALNLSVSPAPLVSTLTIQKLENVLNDAIARPSWTNRSGWSCRSERSSRTTGAWCGIGNL